MKALIETRNTRPERVFLVGAEFKSRTARTRAIRSPNWANWPPPPAAKSSATAGKKLDAPTPATFIGKGKAEEFAAFCRRNDVDTVIFDDELSPAQSRTLEKIFNCKILDRTSLILDIFAQRARTREGKLQIELAQLQHLLPRLTRFWGHLSRQAGGIGMRGGEGESQLESDRRKVQERIDKISRDLEPSAASAPPSAPAASAASGRSRPSSVTPTPANPPCSTRSPVRTFWPRTFCSPRSTRPRAVCACRRTRMFC